MRFFNLIFLPLLVLLSGCEATGRHFRFMGECDAEIAGVVPPNYVQRIARYETNCSGRGTGSVDRTGSISTNNSSNCTTYPIYETIDLNYEKRLQLRNQCIDRKKSTYQSSLQPEVKSYRTNVKQGLKADAISRECGLLDIKSKTSSLSNAEKQQASRDFESCLIRLEKARNAGE